MKDYTKVTQATDSAVQYDEGLKSYMVRVYNYMGLGVLLTGLIAYFASQSEAFLSMVLTITPEGQVSTTPFYLFTLAAPLGPWLVYFIRGSRLSYKAIHAVFWSYAALMGLSMFSIFLVFTAASIAKVFFMAAALYGGMSLYGYTTKRDLTGIGSFLIMGMWGIMIAFLANAFIGSAGFDYVLSILGLLIFTGLTAYMNQQLKQVYFMVAGTSDEGKTAVTGAMSLYIAFINIFMFLLRFFGEER